MLKIQALEQILNNDENTNEDARKSQVSAADGSGAAHDDDQYGYFVENGSTYNGWVINSNSVIWQPSFSSSMLKRSRYEIFRATEWYNEMRNHGW